MKKQLRFLLMLLACGLMGGCGIYYPQLVDIPMLEKQGDLRVDLAANPTTLGTHTSVAYGVTDHLGVQGNLNLSLAGAAGQGALGWYTHWGKQVLEAYVGTGMGYTTRRGLKGWHQWGNFNSIFIQGDYGWNNLAKNHIDIAFGIKYGFLTGVKMSQNYDSEIALRTESVRLLEPTINLRFGWEHLKLCLRGGYSMTAPTQMLIDGDSYFTFSIGLNYFWPTRRIK